eukprot:TCONS_00027603-protein
MNRYYLIVFLVSFVVYSNTLTAGFVYDDTRCIVKNQDILPSTRWTKIFANDFWGTPLSHSGSHKSYRPLCILSFRFNYWLGGLEPSGYHLLNVLLHGVVSCLFCYFCFVIHCDEELSFFGGLLFTLHPIHTEAVAGVVGRADVGAAFFFVASILLYHRAVKDLENISKIDFIESLIMAFCSTFTKEQGITVLGVLVVYELLVVSRCNLAYPTEVLLRLRATGGHVRIFFLIATTATILYLRFLIMGNSLPDFAPADNPAASENNFLTRLLTFLYLPAYNLWLLIYPARLSYDYSMFTIPLVEEISAFENVLSFTLYITLFFVAVLFLKYCRKFGVVHYDGTEYYIKRNKSVIYFKPKDTNINKVFISENLNQLILGLAMLILPFLPATNLFFYVGFIVAERILYIPSIGFCFLMVTGVKVLKRYRGVDEDQIRKILLVILVLFAAKTYHRNFVWHDEESLYRSGLATSPAKSYGNLGNILVEQGKKNEGELAYRKALRYRFNMADTHYNLGILLQESQRYEEAIGSYKAAVKYRPRLAAAHLNLGVTYMSMKKLHDAIKVFKNATDISDHGLKDPHQHATSLSHIRYNLGKALFEVNEYQESLNVFLDALQKIPDGYECHSMYNMIGQCYSEIGKHDHAQVWYFKALHSKPDHIPALLTVAKNLAEHEFIKGDGIDWEKIEEHMNHALSLAPNRLDIYVLFASFYEKKGDFRNGIRILQKALMVDPKHIQTLSMLSSFHRIRNENEEALRYLEQALQAEPKNVTTLLNMGAMLHLMGKFDEAELRYRDALEIQPGNKLLLENIQKLQRQKLKMAAVDNDGSN